MKAPYYRIYLEGKVQRELSDYVSNFSYEDCIKEDSQVEFDFYQDKINLVLDELQLETGMQVSFQFGFMGEQPSKIRFAVVKDIEPSYTQQGVYLKVRALDKGVDIKRSAGTKVWKKSRSSDIVAVIAKKYGLKPVVDNTTKVWDSIPQGNMSDLDFAKYLAGRETDGNFITYIRDDKFYFVRRNMKGTSGKTYVWGDGENGDIISFRPKHRESTGKHGKNKTNLIAFDKATKKAVKASADDKTAKSNTVLGNVHAVYNAALGERGREFIEKNIVSPAATDEASNLANKHKKDADLATIKATLETLGDVTREPNTIITITGVAQSLTGNYLVVKVKHSIGGGGFKTTQELEKNGKRIGTDKAADKNTTVGPEKGKATIKVAVYKAPIGKRLEVVTQQQ